MGFSFSPKNLLKKKNMKTTIDNKLKNKKREKE